MIRDFASFDAEQPIECDLCIAGAGAAGISMALEFAGQGERVVLLESGGLEFEEATHELSVGRNVGRAYYDLDITRTRVLGGATTHWGGMCTRLDPLDFEKRDWVPYSGWPIAAAALDPYYPSAHQLLGLGEDNYVPAEIAPQGTEFLTFRPDRIRPKMWRYSTPPTNFGEAYRDALAQASNLDVLLHANLVEVETDDASRSVASFRIATLAGRSARVRARLYVLALGALENARLLLNSDRVVAGGVGNQRDLVGRFFMEHIGIIAGSVLSIKDGWHQSYADLFAGDRQVRCGLTASPELQAREGTLNPMAMFGEKAVVRPRSAGYTSLFQIKEQLVHGELPDDLGQHLLNIITDADGVVRGMYERVDPAVYITMEAEQSPNPDSRMLLGSERDQLGLRRAHLDWRLSALDKRSARRLVELIGQELARLDVGRVQMEEWLAEDDTLWSDEIGGHYHHMGTTRMASDPSQGVVDANCRVFGVANLYLAGSSVFTTGGCANPTLNLVALALRLAEHIRGVLA